MNCQNLINISKFRHNCENFLRIFVRFLSLFKKIPQKARKRTSPSPQKIEGLIRFHLFAFIRLDPLLADANHCFQIQPELALLFPCFVDIVSLINPTKSNPVVSLIVSKVRAKPASPLIEAHRCRQS